MLNNLCRTILILALVTALLSISMAQDAHVALTNVPFDFWLFGERLPKGKYLVTTPGPTIFCFRGIGTGVVQEVFTEPNGKPVSSRDARLEFVWFKGRYQLRKLRGPDGTWQLNTAEDLPEQAPVRDVPIAYADSR